MKFNTGRSITLAILLIFSASASAQQSYTLQQAIEYGLQNQNGVRNAIIDEQLAKAKKNEIRAIGLPQINGYVDVKNFAHIPTSFLPDFISPAIYGVLMQEGLVAPRQLSTSDVMPVQFGTKWNASLGADASWLLLDASYFVGMQGATVYMDLAKKNVQRTKADAAVAISKAYYGALIADERMKLLVANVERVKKLRDDTRVLFDNGFVEKVDLDRIDVTYKNLVIEKDKVQRLIELSKTLLKYQMGLDVNTDIALADKLESITFTEPSAEKGDISKRIEYQLMEAQVKAGKLLLMREKVSYFPNIALYSSASTNAQRQEFNFLNSEKWYPTVVVGARLGVPIFNGGMKKYKTEQAKLNLLKTENDKKFVEQSLNLELNNARTMLTNSALTLENQRKNITVAEDVYRISKLKYEQGVGSNLEVLTAETSLKEAQTNYYNALYEALIAKVDYEKATGVIVK